VWTELWAKHRLLSNAWEPIPPTGEKKGRKRSLLTDGRGVPLSIVGAGANRHDCKLLDATLDSVIVKRPKDGSEHLCADAGYKGKECLETAVRHGYQPHIKQRKEEAQEKSTNPNFKARRWVVERTHSWLNRWRKLLVSFEKTESSYLGLLKLACALICWRQTMYIYG
jgi:putative transposase